MTAPSPLAIILPDLGGGGAQRVMLTLAGSLDPSVFDVRLLVMGGSQAFADRVPSGIAVEIGRAARLRDGLPWLLRQLRSRRPAIAVSVMGYLNLSLLACRPLLPKGMRLVVREANTIAATATALPRWLPGLQIYRTLYPRADAVVCPTAAIQDELLGLGAATPRQSVVIPNPVAADDLRERVARPSRRPGPGLRLVCVGRLTRQKGIDRLVEILPALPPDTHVDVFGTGPEQAAIESRLAALGQSHRMTLRGFSAEVAEWMAGADALLLPSRWEGLPNVVLESLALGTPVITSDEAGVAELEAELSPGALRAVPVASGFAAAIGLLVAHASPDRPRASLLPSRYRKDAVISRWDALLTKLAASASSQPQ